MKIVKYRTTSIHRPSFLEIDGQEIRIDGIDEQVNEYTMDDRWNIEDVVRNYEVDVKAHQGPWGEFYTQTIEVPDNFTIKDFIRGLENEQDTCEEAQND